MTVYLWIDHQQGDKHVDEATIRRDNPLTVYPVPFAPQAQRYTPIPLSGAPSYDPSKQALVLKAPDKDHKGQWKQDWALRNLTAEEIRVARKASVPLSVTRAQGKAALIRAGLWPQALKFVAGIKDEKDRALAEVALHDTTEWRRDSPFLAKCAAALKLGEDKLDDLFLAAAAEQL